MEKSDLVKKYKHYYTAKAYPELIEIEPAQFLSVTGQGDPSGTEFLQKIQALYPVAYTLKFMCKEEKKDFIVPKLEGFWWFDEKKYQGLTIGEAPKKVPRNEWNYRLLIRMPEFIKKTQVQTAIQKVALKKPLSLVQEIGLFEHTEGKCVQMLHVGPFSNEPDTLQLMLAFMEANGLKRNGLHHEIYLSDFRKTSPEKLKTILREPVK